MTTMKRNSRSRAPYIKIAALALLAGLAASGCFMKFNVPEEFKGKKTVEDPPLGAAPAPVERAAA